MGSTLHGHVSMMCTNLPNSYVLDHTYKEVHYKHGPVFTSTCIWMFYKTFSEFLHDAYAQNS